MEYLSDLYEFLGAIDGKRRQFTYNNIKYTIWINKYDGYKLLKSDFIFPINYLTDRKIEDIHTRSNPFYNLYLYCIEKKRKDKIKKFLK